MLRQIVSGSKSCSLLLMTLECIIDGHPAGQILEDWDMPAGVVKHQFYLGKTPVDQQPNVGWIWQAVADVSRPLRSEV